MRMQTIKWLFIYAKLKLIKRRIEFERIGWRWRELLLIFKLYGYYFSRKANDFYCCVQQPPRLHRYFFSSWLRSRTMKNDISLTIIIDSEDSQWYDLLLFFIRCALSTCWASFPLSGLVDVCIVFVDSALNVREMYYLRISGQRRNEFEEKTREEKEHLRALSRVDGEGI